MRNLLILLLVSYVLSAEAQTLMLSLGQSEKIKSTTGSLWIEDKKILQGESATNGWILRGLREGSTYVQSGENLYKVHVLHPKNRKLLESLNNEIKKFVGLTIEVRNGQILIVGRLYQWQEWEKLSHIFKSNDIPYVFEAEISEKIKEKAQEHFALKMKEQNLVPLKIKFTKSPELKIADSQEDFDKYSELLRPFGVSLVKDKNAIDMLPTVKLEMTILEISKNIKRKFGFAWPDSFSAQIFPNFSWDSFSAQLDVLEQNGQAKVLASPNLLCRSGQESSFLVGGEFPIKVATKNTKHVVWKNYGISLKFKPRADSSGRMSISIDSEVSSLDTSLMVDGVPALKTHKVSSHFDLLKSELVTLSGLIKEDQGKHSDGLPGLSNLPILGPIFGSQDFQNNKSELVIFVRPSVVNLNQSVTNLKSPEHLLNNTESEQ